MMYFLFSLSAQQIIGVKDGKSWRPANSDHSQFVEVRKTNFQKLKLLSPILQFYKIYTLNVRCHDRTSITVLLGIGKHAPDYRYLSVFEHNPKNVLHLSKLCDLKKNL